MPKKPAPRRNLPQPPRQQARPVTPQQRTGTRPQALQPWQRQGLQRAQATGDPSSFLASHPGVLRNRGLREMQQLRRPPPRPPVPGQAGGNMAQQMGVGQQPQPQMPLGGYQQPQFPQPPQGGMWGPGQDSPGMAGDNFLGGAGGWGMAGGNMGDVGSFFQGGDQWRGGQTPLRPGAFNMGPFGMAGGNMGDAGFGGGQQLSPAQIQQLQAGGQQPTYIGGWGQGIGWKPPSQQERPDLYQMPNQRPSNKPAPNFGGLMGQVNPGMQNVLQNRMQQMPTGLSAGQQRRFQAGQPYTNNPPQPQAPGLNPGGNTNGQFYH